ncbi:MAG: hypothetical protein H6733_05235 [Alphaproteobacteria bacterium]|nr:hypothetical protein [Alphaproteobacteria bacterium]
MSADNPFEAPVAAPVEAFTASPFDALSVLRTSAPAAARATLPVLALSVVAYVAVVIGVCACLVPGLFLAPLAAAAVVDAFLAAVDGRPILSGARLDPLRQGSRTWPTAAALVCAYLAFGLAISTLSMGAQVLWGRAAFVLPSAVTLALAPLSTALGIAVFAWRDQDLTALTALQRAAAVVRVNVGAVYALGAVVVVSGSLLGLPFVVYGPDYDAFVADPFGYQPPRIPWPVYLLLYPAMAAWMVWTWTVYATVWRTQAPARPA